MLLETCLDGVRLVSQGWGIPRAFGNRSLVHPVGPLCVVRRISGAGQSGKRATPHGPVGEWPLQLPDRGQGERLAGAIPCVGPRSRVGMYTRIPPVAWSNHGISQGTKGRMACFPAAAIPCAGIAWLNRRPSTRTRLNCNYAYRLCRPPGQWLWCACDAGPSRLWRG
jgi:hypothetical protein